MQLFGCFAKMTAVYVTVFMETVPNHTFRSYEIIDFKDLKAL